MTVQLRHSVEKVKLVVTDKLANSVIIGSDYCDLNILSLKHIRLDNESTAPIIQQPSLSNTAVSFPEEQQFENHKDRASPKIKMTRGTKLEPGNQTWVGFCRKKEGTVMV